MSCYFFSQMPGFRQHLHKSHTYPNKQMTTNRDSYELYSAYVKSLGLPQRGLCNQGITFPAYILKIPGFD